MQRMLGFFFVAVFVLTGIACTGSGINRGDISLISIDEEWALGAQLADDIDKEMKILDDPGIMAYVTAMGNRIVAQAKGDTPVADRPWTFHVIEDETINAFNIPGGHVYLHSGLVAKAGDYAELMGVVSHEVAHGLARHGVENLSKQYGVSLLLGLALGKDPQAYQEILASVLAGGAIMKFSRNAENEADRLGAGYMYGAGVDPDGMVDFFRVLLEQRQRQPSSIEQFFSSHPLTEDRIDNVETMIANMPPASLTRTDPGFPGFQSRVASVSGR